ncbi:MAG: lipopolysaccharide biosynthesis protein [Aquabacterium sp.]|uniref:lipopolysaccharide biosynthesis protein n=1 Tax=Aquabacterium sp. TaxID=1872578 RepID=UPI003BC599C3
MSLQTSLNQTAASSNSGDDLLFVKIAQVLFRKVPFSLIIAAIGALITYWGTSFIPPTYVGRTLLLPPQSSQSGAAAAMQSLGAAAGVSLPNAGRNMADLYASLLWSFRITNRVIDQFDLKSVYGESSRDEVRKRLQAALKVEVGKKDGLILLTVEDRDPNRAADLANGYVQQLKKLTSELALTEAQQRRVLFENQLRQAKENLGGAQRALEQSGINVGVLKTEPKALADTYASLKARVTDAKVRLQYMRSYLTEQSAEYKAAQAQLDFLQSDLKRLESSGQSGAASGYVDKYREYKYYENLFELFAKQLELARLDEAKEGAVIQVVDVATPPERADRPRRAYIAAFGFLLVFVISLIFYLWPFIKTKFAVFKVLGDVWESGASRA